MFVRIISNTKKWTRLGNDSKSKNLPADCFNDLKTTQNTLSLWKIDSTDSADICEQLVAVGAAGRSKIDKIVFVELSEQELEEKKLTLQQDNPQCDYLNPDKSDFINRHYDIIEIDHNDLFNVAEIIMNKIESKAVRILTKKQVKQILLGMKSQSIIINKGLQKDISSELFSQDKEL